MRISLDARDFPAPRLPRWACSGNISQTEATKRGILCRFIGFFFFFFFFLLCPFLFLFFVFFFFFFLLFLGGLFVLLCFVVVVCFFTSLLAFLFTCFSLFLRVTNFSSVSEINQREVSVHNQALSLPPDIFIQTMQDRLVKYLALCGTRCKVFTLPFWQVTYCS